MTNSPYILVGTFERPCPSSSPRLAGLYDHGLLDVNLGQQVSFQSSYKSTLRIEVPVWPDTLQALLPNTAQDAEVGAEAAEEEEEEEDEVYVPPDGQGCFAFRQSLLLRAKDTYEARSNGNKYEVISQWLLTGLAMVLSKPNWKFIAKRGTIAATPQNQLREYYRIGYPPGTDSTRQPYGQQRPNVVPVDQWQAKVEWYTNSRYLSHMEAVSRDKSTCSSAEFYHTMDRRNPVLALDNAAARTAQTGQAEATQETTSTTTQSSIQSSTT